MFVHRIKRLTAVLLFLFLLVIGTVRSADAAIYDCDSTSNFQFSMWVDDDQDVVYGVYILFNASSDDSRPQVLPTRVLERIQNWARTVGFAVMGTRFDAPGNSEEDIQQSPAVITALQECGELSGHPEIANAPVVTDGLSLGGYNSINFASLYPERTIAYVGGGAGRMPPTVLDNPAFARVPGFFYHGSEDQDLEDALARSDEFMPLRQEGIEVSFFVQWGVGHETGSVDFIGFKFLTDVVYLRYPADGSPVDGPVDLIDIPLEGGWLADPATWEGTFTLVEPYADSASPRDRFWLPTRDTAFLYRSHATRDKAIAFVSPSPLGGDSESFTNVDPGDTVDIEVSVGSLSNVEMVEVFDGGRSIAELTSPPYTATWTAEGIGAHTLIPVATLADGSRRTGFTAAVMVLGSGVHPGGGSPGGDGGEDGGDGGDTGGDGGDDDDGDGDGDGNGDGDGDGGGGGGGCTVGRTSHAGGAADLALALLAGVIVVGARARRRARRA